MCINEGVKNSKPMRQKDYAAKGVDKYARTVVVTVENDESTTVGHDVHFEAQRTEVAFLTKLTDMFRIGIGLIKLVLNLTACLVDIDS